MAEAYPDLKANQGFLQLQARISEIEGQIADRREFYNDTVATFNTRLGQIPDKWVAGWLGFTPAELFHATRRGPRGRRDQVRDGGLSPSPAPERCARPPVLSRRGPRRVPAMSESGDGA